MNMHNPPLNNGEKAANGRFTPGNKLGKNGRPLGSRNKTTMAIEQLLDNEAELLTRKVIEMAMNGDITALRLCLERLLPPRKDRPIILNLEPIDSIPDTVKAMGQVTNAVTCGNITPTEGISVAAMIDTYRKCIETNEIEKKLAEIEKIMKEQGLR